MTALRGLARCRRTGKRASLAQGNPYAGTPSLKGILRLLARSCAPTSRGDATKTHRRVAEPFPQGAAVRSRGGRRTGSRQCCGLLLVRVQIVLHAIRSGLAVLHRAAGPAFDWQTFDGCFVYASARKAHALLAAGPYKLMLAAFRLGALFAPGQEQLVLAERRADDPCLPTHLARAPLVVVLADASASALSARGSDAVVLADAGAVALEAAPPLALVVADARATYEPGVARSRQGTYCDTRGRVVPRSCRSAARRHRARRASGVVPHSLQRLRWRRCSQKLLPPHCLQWLRRRPCSQNAPPPQSLQRLGGRPCGQKYLLPRAAGPLPISGRVCF